MEVTAEQLRRSLVFQQASDEDLAEILRVSALRQVEEGEYFFLQGDPSDHAYVLTQGQVKLLQSNPTGQVVNLRTVYPWQLFGALGAVRETAEYPASAQALQDSAALAIPSSFFKLLLERRPQLSMDMMQLMTSYIMEMQSRYRELATERVEQRICRAMLRLAAQSGQRAEDGIHLSLSREDLAEMTGTTLHTVSRVLADWHRRGLVEAGREYVRLIKPHDLVRLADGLP
ncbi:MAG TPA: Crp/Fnr family transcriptional regulator [Anaerolineales bacterium]|nr:Crp/Fnr family transcriptional regulator [Anaerolineales bacterium]